VQRTAVSFQNISPTNNIPGLGILFVGLIWPEAAVTLHVLAEEYRAIPLSAIDTLTWFDSWFLFHILTGIAVTTSIIILSITIYFLKISFIIKGKIFIKVDDPFT
jgi:hypothetical protein